MIREFTEETGFRKVPFFFSVIVIFRLKRRRGKSRGLVGNL
jgi:hypothetical protein